MAIRKMNNGLTEATKGVLNMTDDFVNQMIGADFDLKTIEGVEAQDLKMMQDTVKLYNNQVFVADNIKEVIPEFLML